MILEATRAYPELKRSLKTLLRARGCEKGLRPPQADISRPPAQVALRSSTAELFRARRASLTPRRRTRAFTSKASRHLNRRSSKRMKETRFFSTSKNICATRTSSRAKSSSAAGAGSTGSSPSSAWDARPAVLWLKQLYFRFLFTSGFHIFLLPLHHPVRHTRRQAGRHIPFLTGVLFRLVWT